MNELQYETFQLFQQIIEICDEENIPYILLGGTLLGAVRHQGFIPWDDDMDIGFTRVNYEKFLDAASEKLDPSHYEVYRDNTAMMPYGLSRIVNKKIKINMRIQSTDYLFIDIIPLDKLPENTKWAYTKFRVVNSIINIRGNVVQYSAKWKRVIAKLIDWGTRPLSLSLLKNWRYKLMVKYNGNGTDKYYNLVSPYPFGKEYFTEKELSEFQNCVFETMQIEIPIGSVNFLERLYGEWEVEPPENERRVHLMEWEREK